MVPAPDEGAVGLTEFRELLRHPESRSVVVEMVSLASLLEGSVVEPAFSAPDTLVKSLELSAIGREVFESVRAARPRLKPNDVKLGLFVAIGCPDGLFFTVDSDLDGFRKGLSVEMLKRRVQFAYVFGRELHDRAAKLYPGKYELDVEQTQRLLRDLPIGVFQEGYTTTGPFGALRATAARYLPSGTSAPGYYCSDITCSAIHNIALSTSNHPSRTAPANRALHQVSEHLRRTYGNREDPYARAAREAIAIEENRFRIAAPEAVIEVLADGLTLDELRTVVEVIFRLALKVDGAKSWSVRLSRVIADPTEFIAGLSRAELLQLALLFDDDGLIRGIDQAVRSARLELSSHEIRETRIDRFNNRGITAEIGTRGVRLVAGGSFVADRLQELLHYVYFESGQQHPADLAYLVGASDATSGTELLDMAVRAWEPEEVLRRLVLASRASFLAAAERIGLEPADPGNHEEVLQDLLWKLGATTRTLPRTLDKLAALEDQLRQSASGGDQDDTRGVISNVFAALEAAMRMSLEYTTWALTTDHYIEESSFIYDPTPNPETRLAFIEQHAPTKDERLRLRLADDNTLSPLGGGFARLAKILSTMNPDEHLRERDQLPLICRDGPREFAFGHTIPFLDLKPSSRQITLEALAEIAAIIQNDTLLKVRNAPLHGAAEFPALGEFLMAADKVRQLRTMLAASGLHPTAFRRESTTIDSLGRISATYSSGGTVVGIGTPSWAVAPHLPAGKVLLIMPICEFSGPGPLRFLLKSGPSEDPYWKGWPRRWQALEHYARPEGAEASGMRRDGDSRAM